MVRQIYQQFYLFRNRHANNFHNCVPTYKEVFKPGNIKRTTSLIETTGTSGLVHIVILARVKIIKMFEAKH